MLLQWLIDMQWTVFVTLEVLSFISLIIFGLLRYGFNRKKMSLLAIYSFLLLLIVEALIGILIYQATGEISSFQVIVGIFVIYACTFGIFDFIKLDRWMRKAVGKWRNVELLTEKDYAVMKRQKDPHYLAKKYRLTATVHLFIFIIGQSILWYYGTSSLEEMLMYAKDFSWIESGTAENSPYANDLSYSIGVIWGIVFIVDFIYSLSYTFFPSKPKA